jgi:hypothetical protein
MRLLLAALLCVCLTSCNGKEEKHHDHDGHDHDHVSFEAKRERDAAVTKHMEAIVESEKSSFAKDVDRKERGIRLQQFKMSSFSRDLQLTMGLTDEQVITAEKNKQEWVAGEWIISARNFCHMEYQNDGWAYLLYARPANMGNVESNPVDGVQILSVIVGWYYVPKGTATILVPDDDIRKKILAILNNYEEIE